jgi:putative acetyltransferase
MHNKPTTRPITYNDYNEIKQLFVETVTEVCSKDYTPEQIEVWVSSAKNTQRWLDIFTHQYVLVAEIGDKIVGFGTLENGDYLDLLYVHKDFQRKGIANLLYLELEKVVEEQKKYSLSADVSKTARPFFESKGFTVIKEQNNLIQGVEIVNYKMEKNYLIN